MAKDYTSAVALGKRLVEKFGRPVIVHKRSRTDADGSRPWQGATVTSDDTANVIAAFVAAGAGGLGSSLIDRAGQLNKTISKECLIAPGSDTTFDFNDADTVEDGARVYKVIVREEFKPGDTSLLFILGLES